MKGECLWQALEKKNIVIDRPCNGNGTCGRCAVQVERFGKVKSCQFRLPGTYEVMVPEQMQFTTVGCLKDSGEERGENRWKPVFAEKAEWDAVPAAAVDIGTTTVAILVSYRGKQTVRNFTNPQRALGADVMSRIRAAAEGEADRLQQMLKERLEEELSSAVHELNADADTCSVIIGANTTMTHILCGWSCEGLGKAPFTPVSLELQEELWRISGGQEARVTILPGISAFIGADIVSGIFATGMLEEQEPVLLLDLGTNGEMALISRGSLLTASASAGPAFEGSDLAVQIHGAGIMHCLHDLRRKDIIDESGLLAEPYFEDGYPVSMIPGMESVPDGARITQEDIREIQMAKAAIRAGIEILLEESGICAKEVSKVYLAGGMGYYLDAKDAVAIGLLPEEFMEKTIATGNTSLLGAVRYLKEETASAKEELASIRSRAKEIVLADHGTFEERYIGSMDFPSLF